MDSTLDRSLTKYHAEMNNLPNGTLQLGGANRPIAIALEWRRSREYFCISIYLRVGTGHVFTVGEVFLGEESPRVQSPARRVCATVDPDPNLENAICKRLGTINEDPAHLIYASPSQKLANLLQEVSAPRLPAGEGAAVGALEAPPGTVTKPAGGPAPSKCIRRLSIPAIAQSGSGDEDGNGRAKPPAPNASSNNTKRNHQRPSSCRCSIARGGYDIYYFVDPFLLHLGGQNTFVGSERDMLEHLECAEQRFLNLTFTSLQATWGRVFTEKVLKRLTPGSGTNGADGACLWPQLKSFRCCGHSFSVQAFLEFVTRRTSGALGVAVLEEVDVVFGYYVESGVWFEFYKRGLSVATTNKGRGIRVSGRIKIIDGLNCMSNW